MFDELFVYFKDNLPVWLVFLILLVYGVIKYGAKFLNEMVEVADNYAQKSDAVKNEYIAFLKKSNEKLSKEVDELKKKLDEK